MDRCDLTEAEKNRHSAGVSPTMGHGYSRVRPINCPPFSPIIAAEAPPAPGPAGAGIWDRPQQGVVWLAVAGGCSAEDTAGCTKDIDCRAGRICVSGDCVNSSNEGPCGEEGASCQSSGIGDRYRSMASAQTYAPADAPVDEVTELFYRQIRSHLLNAGASIVDDELETRIAIKWTADQQTHRMFQSRITGLNERTGRLYHIVAFEMISGPVRDRWAEVTALALEEDTFYLLVEDEYEDQLIEVSPLEAHRRLRGSSDDEAIESLLGGERSELNGCIADNIDDDICQFTLGVAMGPIGAAICGGVGQAVAQGSCLALLLDDASVVGIADDALIPLCMAVVGITVDLTCEVATGTISEIAGMTLCGSGLSCFARIVDDRCECALPTSCDYCESGCAGFMGAFVCSVINRLSGPIFRFFGGRKQHILSRLCSGFSSGGRQWCDSFLEEVCENLVGNYDPGVCERSCADFCAGGSEGTCGDLACDDGETCHNCESDCGFCPEICVDQDGDGYGEGCDDGSDCSDNVADIHPGAVEICGNGVDEDCDGDDTPCVCGDGECQDAESCESCGEDCGDCDCQDADGDRYGPGCPDGPDCNDQDADIHPSAEETCNGVDDNCNQHIDERLEQDCQNHCAIDGQRLCLDGIWGPCIAPDTPREICNRLDDDCDGEIDEGLPSNACLGCAELPGRVDAPCGACGHWRCDGTDALACQGDRNPDEREATIESDPWWIAPDTCLAEGVEVEVCLETHYSVGERVEFFIVEADPLSSNVVHIRVADVECDDWDDAAQSFVTCVTWVTEHSWDGLIGGDPEYQAVVFWYDEGLRSEELGVHDGDGECD